ncbi:hypothetical protein MAH4_23670 [Sessilibacter sp. MAH4]
MRKGSNYVLFKAPAGSYRFSRIEFNEISAYELYKKYWSFDVVPQKINYVGEFKIDSLHKEFYLSNESSSALEFIETYYSKLIGERLITYVGPGEDDFFEFVRNIKEDK